MDSTDDREDPSGNPGNPRPLGWSPQRLGLPNCSLEGGVTTVEAIALTAEAVGIGSKAAHGGDEVAAAIWGSSIVSPNTKTIVSLARTRGGLSWQNGRRKLKHMRQ
jgi:hypothetical protein